jgi:hypothetical protein
VTSTAARLATDNGRRLSRRQARIQIGPTIVEPVNLNGFGAGVFPRQGHNAPRRHSAGPSVHHNICLWVNYVIPALIAASPPGAALGGPGRRQCAPLRPAGSPPARFGAGPGCAVALGPAAASLVSPARRELPPRRPPDNNPHGAPVSTPFCLTWPAA